MLKNSPTTLKRTESEPGTSADSARKRTLVSSLRRNRKGSSIVNLTSSSSSLSYSLDDQWAITSSDVGSILNFMVELVMGEKGGEVKELQNFLAAFSNFGIVKEELFSVFVQRYHLVTQKSLTASDPELPPSPTSPPHTSFDLANSPSNSPLLKKNDSLSPLSSPLSETTHSPTPRWGGGGGVGGGKGEREALQSILRVWLLQSGALYKRQHPQFFRTVASFLSDVKDPRMNGLKLQLIKNKSASELDSALPFYQAISQASIEPLVRDGFEELLEIGLFKKFSVQEVAEGITFSMFRVYNSIGPSELHDGSWQGKERMVRAPHIHALSVLFNRIALLCVCEILGPKSPDMRLENFLKCLELTRTLKKMNNFEGLSAVSSIFSNAAVSRLKPLWFCLDSKALKRIKKLESLFKPQKNYKNYTELVSKATPPLLPWLAPKLRELRFMYDGNSKTTSEGYLSYGFLQMVGTSVNGYLEYKRIPYNNIPVPKSELVHILEAVPNHDKDYVEDCLYARSQALYES